MNQDSKFELFKIQFPEERKQQRDVTIGLESYLATRFSKGLWYSEDHNAVLLDIPEKVAEFHEDVQRLCRLPSGGFHCELKTLEEHELNQKEQAWLEEIVQSRVDLLNSIFPGLANKIPDPTFNIHLISLSKV